MEADADLLDVGEAPEDTEAADDEGLGAALDVAAGGVGRGLPERGEDVGEIDAERGHLRRVGLHVDLALEAAVRDDVGDAGDLEEARPHRPLLERAQRHRVGALAFEGVAVDLADRRGHRPEARLHALGQLGLGEALHDLLLRAERVGGVVEGERDEREPEERDAAQPEEPRRAVERALERERDAPLDLLGGLPGVEGDDLNLGVSRIRKRFDREPRVGVVAPHREGGREDERREPVAEREPEEPFEHGLTLIEKPLNRGDREESRLRMCAPDDLDSGESNFL